MDYGVKARELNGFHTKNIMNKVKMQKIADQYF